MKECGGECRQGDAETNEGAHPCSREKHYRDDAREDGNENEGDHGKTQDSVGLGRKSGEPSGDGVDEPECCDKSREGKPEPSG